MATVACLVVAAQGGGLTHERVLLAFAVGAVLAPVLGLGARRGARLERANLLAAVPALGSLDSERQTAAVRAAGRGPVPDDPQVRLVAAEAARYRLARSMETRATGVGFAVFFLFTQLAVGLFVAPWGWVGVALFTGAAVHAVLAPRWYAARVVALEGAATDPVVATS